MINTWLLLTVFWGIVLVKKAVKIWNMVDPSSWDDDFIKLVFYLYAFAFPVGLVCYSKHPLWIW